MSHPNTTNNKKPRTYLGSGDGYFDIHVIIPNGNIVIGGTKILSTDLFSDDEVYSVLFKPQLPINPYVNFHHTYIHEVDAPRRITVGTLYQGDEVKAIYIKPSVHRDTFECIENEARMMHAAKERDRHE